MPPKVAGTTTQQATTSARASKASKASNKSTDVGRVLDRVLELASSNDAAIKRIVDTVDDYEKRLKVLERGPEADRLAQDQKRLIEERARLLELGSDEERKAYEEIQKWGRN